MQEPARKQGFMTECRIQDLNVGVVIGAIAKL